MAKYLYRSCPKCGDYLKGKGVWFEAAGAGNGFTVRLVRHRQTKETVTDRHHLRDTAPVLDPTDNLYPHSLVKASSADGSMRSPPDLRFEGLTRKRLSLFVFA